MGELYKIEKVAVLGTGVMGAQIAAHLTNANIPVLGFDISQEVAEKGVEASTIGLMQGVSSLIAAFSPAVAAFMVDALTITAVFYYVATLMILAASLMLFTKLPKGNLVK